jgi:chromosomal replication initiator protein
MNMHITEQQKQVAHYAEIKKRLTVAGKAVPVAIVDIEKDDLRKQVEFLKAELNDANTRLKQAGIRRRAAAVKIITSAEERIERLELDLADARARILSQAQMLCKLDSEMIDIDIKRPVSVIVAEVLQDFPDITWADIISVRRTLNLIKPRHLCMAAVYNERKDLSLPQLGKVFHRDHTVILYAVKKAETAAG